MVLHFIKKKKKQWYGLHDDVPSYKDKQTD